MIKLNTNFTYFKTVLEQYRSHKEYQRIYLKSPNTSLDIVNDISGIPCFSIFSDVNNIINSPSPIIGIDNISEGINSISQFRKLPKDKKYIILSNGWWDIDKYKIDIDYVPLYWNYFWLNNKFILTMSININFFANTTYDYTIPKSNLFCSLIGFRREARDMLVASLTKNIVDTEYILNYAGLQYGNDSRELDIAYDFSNYDSYKSISTSEQLSISDSIPINLYNTSYFNLVVETNFGYSDEFHLTEKTLKPIIAGMPFVLVAGPGYCAKLRDLGFKTFNTLWSEEYDSIVDTRERINAILELINSLKSFDWQKYQSELISITNHNKLNFMYNNSALHKQLDTFETTLTSL